MGEAAIIGSIGDAISGLFGWLGTVQQGKNINEQGTSVYQSTTIGAAVEESKQESKKTTIIVISVVAIFIALTVTIIFLNKKK